MTLGGSFSAAWTEQTSRARESCGNADVRLRRRDDRRAIRARHKATRPGRRAARSPRREDATFASHLCREDAAGRREDAILTSHTRSRREDAAGRRDEDTGAPRRRRASGRQDSAAREPARPCREGAGSRGEEDAGADRARGRGDTGTDDDQRHPRNRFARERHACRGRDR
jgi:hypothetical protein